MPTTIAEVELPLSGEVISSPYQARARGKDFDEGGTSTSAIVVGIMTDALPQELPDAEVTPIAIEYGTYSVPEVLGAVRADNWLHHRGDLKSPLAKELKADMKERFFPSGDKWREMVWARADQTIGWALKGLMGG